MRHSAIGTLILVAAACTAPDSGRDTSTHPRDLRPAVDAKILLDSARALMSRDSSVALATVDADGQPRVRSVRAFLDPVDPAHPASGATVWIMTRLTTRKVEQVRQHPQVTLYFNDDARASYASIMGTAIVHNDPNDPRAKRHYNSESAKFFWPEFPRGFVMIEVRPKWLEYIGPGISNDTTTWRPQSVVF